MLRAKWLGAKRKAKCGPDPLYPNGVMVDLNGDDDGASCSTPLGYPAPGTGKWFVKCNVCGVIAVIAAAGRTDDPRGVAISCKFES